MSNCNTLIVEPVRDGNNLNVIVGAAAGTNPTILTLIVIKQGGGTKNFYPPFDVGGQNVYPNSKQLKLKTTVEDGPLEVQVFACNSDCVASSQVN